MIRNILLTVLIFVFFEFAGFSSSAVKPAIKKDAAIEKRIDELMSRMTLQEKVGQMTQLTLDVFGVGKTMFESEMPFRFDEMKIDTAIRQYKVGSVINTASNYPMDNKSWNKIIKHLQEAAIQTTGIPLLYGVDEIHGTTYTIGGTLFPQQICMGATFNPELVKEAAKVAAYETKAGCIPWNLSPVLDMGRDPRWPRMWETYGEDTYLVTVMGKAAVEGYQGEDPNHIGKNSVAVCLKHYVGYGVPVSGKDRTPSSISDNDMRERHFEPFLHAIKAGALSVMVNSGVNNGVPVHINSQYITTWLKEELNWDGVVVTDWADINNICLRDKAAPTIKDAVMLAINAGIDISMVPYGWDFCIYLKELVEEGKVDISRIDDAVRRILRIKLRLGLFERPWWDESEYPDFASDSHSALALKAAQEAIVLLKNADNILPLSPEARILIAGPNANSMRTLNGGWTLSWQGEKADIYAEKYNTILEALQNRVGAGNVIYEPGVTYNNAGMYWQENNPEIEKAVSAAKNVDYIVLCLGENSYCETPGNLVDLYLSDNQQSLAKALYDTGKPIVLVMNEGRPRIISKIEPLASAILNVMLPGNYGADALADILYGDVNPSGKLPFTYPKFPNLLFTYDYKPCENPNKMEGAYDYDSHVDAQWAFGYGLSYTNFEYSDLKVDKTQFKHGDDLTFTVTVKNTGNRTGKEPVLLFISDEFASITPDNRRLRAFDKIELLPGEKRDVVLKVSGDDLAFIGQEGKWILEKGSFMAQAGDQTISFECTETKEWQTPNRF